ncbi:unnamed protein product [Rotaria sp. Silwood1]|nr:unnamed protein product [Rotaria sp. Silwood1]
MQPTLTLRNEPDVFVNLARKIYDESITNHERIAEAITSEIRKIRLHAISTVYICSSRNKTVLSNKRLKQIQHHQNDDDIDFKKIIVKILGTLADRDKDSISYIYQQSTDEIRCQELFKENIICKLIDLLENIYLSEQTKIHICTIINNYLEHSSSKALNESQLQIFAHVLNNLPYNFELKLEALRSIILTAVKNRHLPDFIIQTLIKNIDKDDNKLNSLAIIALDIVSQRQIIPNVDKLSTKLLVDWIIVNEGAGITCEKMSSDNVDCQSISSLAAEIFVNTLKNNLMINNRTLEHLTKALNSNDKQTCILSAKALYLASETHELGNDVLIELKEHIENKINDVIVYSTVAYTRGLVKLSSNEGSIMKSHMECLPKIYVFDDLQLDEETFADTVNNNILSVLLNVSKHNLFDDHMFVIFNHILSFESCNQVVAIKILYNYSANKYSIPQDTILALENAIDIPEISHEATKVLSNVIKNRQLINEKFLRHLTDNLYLSNDDQLRKESFELLDIANDNQDISDEFFYILELERAISIINSFSLDRNDAMSYLYEMTEQNQKITLNGFKILDKIMSSQFVFDEKIFGILLNTCKNEQSIPDNLINKLVERFNPRQINCQLIDIFQNLVKNNQNIPTKLLFKLEKALENTLISDQVLSIFVLLALKGQYLSENILTKILDKILVLENSLIIEQYLSVIFSLIQNKDYFKKNFLSSLFTFFTRFSTNDISLVLRIQSVLIHILKGNNQNVIRASLNGLKILVTFHKVKLNQKSTDILLDLAGNTICDETMKNDINVLLNISKLDNSQQCKMKLLRLKYKSNDELLEALAKFSKPKLFQQNFDQLNNIINNSSELNEKVLKILLECSNKDKITDTLLYSIIFLMNSTNSKEMRSLCRDLIIETIRAGKIVSNKIISCIVTQNDVLKLIAKKQPIPEKFQHHLNLFSRIVSIDNIDLKDFSEFLENIRHEFNQDYKLSDLSMSKLLSIQITNNDYDICMKFTLNQIEQFDFYKTWLEIEEYTGFQQDQSDILLKLLHRIQLNNMISFNQCNELIRILKNIDFESIYNILSNSSNPYEDILKKFFKDLIFERLSNKEINKKYIDNLVRKMIIKFSFDINFVEENKIKIFDINVQYKNISTLKRSFELQSLNNQIVNVDHRKLTLILSNLLDSQWSFEQLNMIFKNLIALNNEEKRIKEINFLYVLEILSQYSVIPTVENLEKISEALKESAQNWQRLINIIAVEAKFRDIGQLRNVTELIEEFEKTNSQNKNLIKLVDLINNIKSTNLISKIVNQTMGYRIDEKLKKRRQVYISEWTKDEIQEWAKTIKNNVSSYNLNEIMKLVSDIITEQIFRITESQLILPLNSCATGNLTNIFSETVERYLVVDEKQNSLSQNREENSRTYNTIREQIGQNAKDYTIAYSQCEMIHYTKQRDEINSQKFDEKISDYITGVKMNLPANISDILTLAEKHGLELKLVDDPSYEPTHEDKTKCTSIVLYNKRDRDNQENVKVGYFELMSNDTNEYNISNTNNDSAYTVIQQILKRKGICITIEALRHDRAKIIEDNPHQFSIALRAQEWIENHYPQEMNDLLIIRSDKSSRCQSPVISGPDDDNLAICDRCRYTFCKKCYETFHSQAMCPKDYLIEQMKLQKQKELERLQREKEAALAQFTKTKAHKKSLQEQNIATQRYRKIIIKLSEQNSLLQEILTAERINSQVIQYCPQCHIAIEKNGGCSHMHCTRCNFDFTWQTTQEPITTIITPYLENEDFTGVESIKEEFNKAAYLG